MGNYSGRLWTPVFTRLWLGEVLSFLAAQMFLFIVPILAIGEIGATDVEIGLINTGAGFGTALFLLLLGFTADAERKDLYLGWLSIGRAGAVGVLAALAGGEHLNLWAFSIIAFFVAGMTALYDSCFSSAVPRVLPESVLPSANSWIAGLRSAADIGAGAIIGFLYAASGSVVVLGVLAGCYLAASLAPLSFRQFFGTNERANTMERFSLAKVLSGVRFIARDKVQRVLTVSITQFNLFTAAIQAVYVAYAVRYVGMSAAQLGIAGTVGGLLGLLAIGLSSRMIRRFRPVLLVSATFAVPGISGLLIIALPVLPLLGSVLILGLALGLWSGCILINVAVCETIKQQLVPDGVIGKASAATRLFTWGIDPVGAGLATLLLLFLPIGWVLGVAVLGLVGSAAWVLCSREIAKIGAFAGGYADRQPDFGH